MNYVSIVLSIASIICSVFAVLIVSKILQPIDPIDLSAMLLILAALVIVHLAAEASGADDDGNQSES